MKFKLSNELINEIQENKEQKLFNCSLQKYEEISVITCFEENERKHPIIQILRTTSINGSEETLWYLDATNCIGSGAYGDVFSAYLIDSEWNLQEVINKKYFSEQYVIKRMIITDENGVKKIKNEAEKLSRFYPTMKPLFHEGTAYIVTKKLPGKTLNLSFSNEIVKLSFPEKISLIKEIWFAVNRMHHNTIDGKPAIVHGDLHSDNILVEYQYINKFKRYKFNVSLIDFGLSFYQSKDEPYKDVSFEKEPFVNDIFKLGGLFQSFFKKNNYSHENNELFKKTIRFIDKMFDITCSERPTSDEILNFFVAMDNLLTIKALPKEMQKNYKEEISDYLKRIENQGPTEVNKSSKLSLFGFFNYCLNSITSNEPEKKNNYELMEVKKNSN
jgi:serine/threonine protein kinase